MKTFCALVALSLFPAAVSGAWAADKLNVTPEEHAACDADAANLCSAAYPDEDKLLACMRANVAQLTPGCATVFKAGLKRRHIR